MEKIFTDCLKPIVGGSPNFAEKTFMDGSQTSKFVKIFSLKSFLLYGIPEIQTPPLIKATYLKAVHSRGRRESSIIVFPLFFVIL